MIIVFKPSENVKKLMTNYYQKYSKPVAPQYTVFQAFTADVVITLYESGKVMFQGNSADIEASLWVDQERHLNNRNIDIYDNSKAKDKKEQKQFYNISTIGSDEVGTGDYFGPIVVTATYVSKENIPYLTELGVRDSKKLTDDKIKEIAPVLMKKIPYVTFIMDNKSYNSLSNENQNMNKIKAVLHNKVLVNLIKKDNYNYEKIVIDQFVYPKKFYEHINGAKEKITNVTFITKAEDQVMSVGAASIISRYIFLGKMKEMNKKLGILIPLGAGANVDETAKEVLKKYGIETLKEVVKFNFKNTDKIMKKEQ
jgi:ribonuclease HIII